MQLQATNDKFINNVYKSMNSTTSNFYLDNINNNTQNHFQRKFSSNNNIKENNCKIHNRNFYKYCIWCKKDICPNCYKESHFIHDNIKYNDVYLNDSQFDLLKKEYNDYIETFSDILIKIKKWQNTVNKSIAELEQFVKNNFFEIINKMINNYDVNNLNYNTILEYRLIYSFFLNNKEEKTYNKKLINVMKSYIALRNYGKYQYIDENEDLYYTISNETISQLNTSINNGNFVQKGNNIIKFLYETFPLFSTLNKSNDNQNFGKIGENYIKSRNKIDKIYTNDYMPKHLNKSTNNIFEPLLSIKYNIFDNDNEINISQIYEKKKACDKKKNGEIFLDKEEIPIFSHMPTEENNPNNYLKKKWNEVYLTKSPKSSIFTNNEENRNKIGSKIDHLWKSKTMNFFYPSKSQVLNDNVNFDELCNINYKIETDRNVCCNKRPIIFNNNINNYNNINNINSKNNYINTYNINNKLLSERNIKSKVYHHKKFKSNLMGFKSVNLYHTLTERNNENSALNAIDLHNYDTYSLSNTISMTDNKSNKSNKYKNIEQIDNINKIERINVNTTNNLKIKKVKKFTIDINKDLNIGFELGNSECKIGIINSNLNCIELWTPNLDEKNNSGIPTFISFKENSNEIIIGNKAKELEISNPAYTIFNIIKFIGKNSKEIEEKTELWPFKIYNIKTDQPYIKSFSIINKNKNYNFEDLLSLYLRKLFEQLFNSIEIKKNNKDNLIKINIVVTLPNNFTYFQRKIIEKIFQTQLFQKEKKINNNNILKVNKINNSQVLYSFGKYNIQIKNIKIENSSNIGYLYLYQKQIENNFKRKNKNIILIHIEGGSINISLISTLIKNDLSSKENKTNELNKYEIKGINGIEFGEEDFTDIFMNSSLSDLTEKIREKCLKSPLTLAKLRKSFENAKKYFYKKKKAEIKLYDNLDIKITLNNNDYEQSCNEIFHKINELIKDILFKSKISEKEIDDIIFIGNTTNINIIKQRISIIFQGENNELFDKLTNNKYFQNDNDIINEDYIVIGATLQSFNLFSNKINMTKYIEISPISFGIECLNKKMDFIIEKGSIIPKQVNKYVKIPKQKGENIYINIYEGEDEFVYNNKLISSAGININNFKNENKENNYIEILIQFIINSNFNLRVFILDKKTLRQKFECIINIDIVRR